MSIIKKMYSGHEFADWVKQSDSYKNNFSFEGAKALQEYLEDLSDDIGENIEFDPIAWCVEYSEYKDFEQFQSDTGYVVGNESHSGYPDIADLEQLKDSTTVIEFDGGIIVQDF